MRTSFSMMGGMAACLMRQGLCVFLAGFSWGYAQDQIPGHAPERSWLEEYAVPFSQAIGTDRPSFSLGTALITKGHVQFETGYTFSYEQANPDMKSHMVPETLVRVGLLEHLELRVEWPSWTVRSSDQNQSGLQDLRLGFKAGVIEQQEWVPELSFAGQLSIPTGEQKISSNRVDPEFRTIFAYVFHERMKLFGNANIAGPTSQGARFLQLSFSSGLLAQVQELVSGYIEYFGVFPREAAKGSGHFLQTGVLYLLTYHVQVDARVGAGLTRGTEDVFTGAGVSWRF